MSVEEEVELRDVVTQVLDANGCLAKIRAQLRASIFLALDEDSEISNKQPLFNNKLKSYLEYPEGRAMFCIVREFLEFFNLHSTLSVYDAETYLNREYDYLSREKLIEELALDDLKENTIPILMKLIRIAQMKTKDTGINLNGTRNKNEMSCQENESEIILKTESNVCSIPKSKIEHVTNGNMDTLVIPMENELNATYNLNSPSVIFLNGNDQGHEIPVSAITHSSINSESNKEENILNSTYKKDTDDTYEDNSSLAEESNDSNLDKSESLNSLNERSENLSLKSNEKPKLSSQKNDKVKSKSSLSSLSDLPPLQQNKSRVNDILPSLYSKEFKDKSNLRELDKLFDIETEYEEDFVWGSDDLSIKSDYVLSDKSNDVSGTTSQQLQKKSTKPNSLQNKPPSESNIPVMKTKLNHKGGDIRVRNSSNTDSSEPSKSE